MLWFWGFAVVAWATEVQWTAAPELVVPGTMVQLGARVETRHATQASEELLLPPGWTQVMPLGEVDLDAGQGTLRMLGVQPTRAAPAGPATLVYRLRMADGRIAAEASLQMQVEEVFDVEVRPGATPDLLSRGGRAASVDVQIGNRGNGRADLDLRVDCGALVCGLEPTQLALEPGGTAVVTVHMRAPKAPRSSGPATAILHATSGDHASRVSLTTHVVSARPAPVEGGRSLRGHARLGVEHARGTLGAFGQLRARGEPSADSKVDLALSRSREGTLDGELALRRRSLDLRASSRAATPLPWLWPETGPGLRTRVSVDAASIEVGALRTRHRALAFSRAEATHASWRLGLGAMGAAGRSPGSWWLASAEQDGVIRATAQVAGSAEGGAAQHVELANEADRPLHWRARAERIDGALRSTGDVRQHAQGTLVASASHLQLHTTAQTTVDGARRDTRLTAGGAGRWDQPDRRLQLDGQLTYRVLADAQVLRSWTAQGRARGRVHGQQAEVRARLALDPTTSLVRVETTLQLGLGTERHRVDGLAHLATDAAGPASRVELAARSEAGPVTVGLGGRVETGVHLARAIEAVASLRLPRGNIDARVAVAEQASGTQRSARLDWSTPLRIPVARAEGVGVVVGRLVDHRTGEGMSGILVAAGDRTAVTGRQGQFRLTGVPLGAVLLYVDLGGLGDGWVTTEPTPLPLTLLDTQEAVIELGVAPAVRVAGTLMFARGGAGGGLGAGPDLEDGPLAGVLVELSRGTEQLLRRTDAHGRFTFAGIRPGDWTMTVHTGGLPVEVEIVDRVRKLSVAADPLDVQVHARPAPRAMQIQQGFTLDLAPSGSAR
ncbi:MAG: carboxypeptidase regulatory-like domain-containing protein [Deltaproteobacteria bacterium]|nr:MAG: carboxypeptidase regulatory-like domain-containing protein [Deltaproteobacteria bacterium]